MKLTLQTLTGTKLFLDVEPQDNIRKVKVKVFHDLEIKSKVRLLWQNKQLEDTNTLSNYGITEDPTVQMVVEPDTKIKLQIKTLKKGMLSLEMNNSSTVLDLEQELHTSNLLLSAHYSDFYFGFIQLSQEKLPFHLYNIRDGDVLFQLYEGSFKLRIDDAEEFAFNTYISVHGTDTIKEVNQNVLRVMNDFKKEGARNLVKDNIVIFHMHRSSPSVSYSYDELDRDAWTVDQCKIKPLDVLRVICYNYDVPYHIGEVKVDQPGSHLIMKKQLYGLHNVETVHSLRLKIQHQFQIPYEKQNISIGDMKKPIDICTKVNRDLFDKIAITIRK